MKYATIVNTVYGNKVILCKTAKEALGLTVQERYQPYAFGFVTTAIRVEYNKKMARVQTRNQQTPNSFAMIKQTKKGSVVIVYKDSYKLASDLFKIPNAKGAIVEKK